MSPWPTTMFPSATAAASWIRSALTRSSFPRSWLHFSNPVGRVAEVGGGRPFPYEATTAEGANAMQIVERRRGQRRMAARRGLTHGEAKTAAPPELGTGSPSWEGQQGIRRAIAGCLTSSRGTLQVFARNHSPRRVPRDTMKASTWECQIGIGPTQRGDCAGQSSLITG